MRAIFFSRFLEVESGLLGFRPIEALWYSSLARLLVVNVCQQVMTCRVFRIDRVCALTLSTAILDRPLLLEPTSLYQAL
jgi:hypothetical protein